MRRSRLVIVVVAISPLAWLGCNGLLGIEEASFEPREDASPGVDGASSDGPTTTSDAAADAPVDACASDASFVSDPKSCGRCGHDCLGGACVDGRCQPVKLADETFINDDAALVLDATHVYWSNNKSMRIRRVPKGGGPVEIVHAQDRDYGNAFTIVGDDVYFPFTDTDGGIVACAKTGCTDGGARFVVHDTSVPIAVATGPNDTLVWTELQPSGRIGTCALPCNGNATYPVTGESFPLRIGSEGNGVFWATLNTAELRVREGTASPVTIASLPFVRGFAVKGERVFAMVAGEGPYLVPRDGGAAKRISSDGYYSQGVAVDETYAWFTKTSAKGAVQRCPITSCVGVEDVVIEQPYPAAIAVDDKAVYWINAPPSANAAIMRLAK